MRLRLTATSTEIANAINDFPAEYHRDYSEVRPIARRWIAEEQPAAALSRELSSAVGCVLARFGAGRRGAPTLRCEEAFAISFVDGRLHSDIVKLFKMSEAGLGLDAECRRLANGSHVPTALEDFDDALLSVLREISQRLFVDNSNVTYPTKALLLISGLMPALDNRVRAGLGRAGFSGVKKLSFSFLLTRRVPMERS